MSDYQLKSQRFRKEREGDWKQLERLVAKAETNSPSALTDAEILALPVLYRSTLSALSVARSTSLDRALIDYLESLAARAYFFVYGARATPLEMASGFFRRDWPSGVRSIWKETLASAGIFLLGFAVAWVLVSANTEWFYSFVDAGLAGGRDPTASKEALRATLYHEEGSEGLAAFSTFLFTHNAQVALMCFALGFVLGAPTIVLLLMHGAMTAALFHVFWSKGLGTELGGWLLIHGATEIFAILLAGAAGLKIGWSVAFPGDQGRLEAMAAAGRSTGATMVGVVIMLVFAGLLEGFGRQLIVNDIARYAIAGTTLALWLAYFYAPRPDLKGRA